PCRSVPITLALHDALPISAAEKKLVEDLLWNHPFEGYDAPQDYRQQTMVQRIEINNHHIEAVNVHFRGAESRVKKKTSDLPLDRSEEHTSELQSLRQLVCR